MRSKWRGLAPTSDLYGFKLLLPGLLSICGADHSVVHMQRENRRRERTQNTAKNLAKASAGLAGMDGSKSPEAEEQKDAPEELAKDEMIRQILREFMA